MNNSIFIPRRINVGFQKRSDTYTQMLAYVIYYDEKGKLRKEASWDSWRDKSIDPVEYDNEPTEGFVLNKKVGGYRSDWAGFRQAYVRVYDPRGFEFEITVPNLLYILENTSAIKGKGLEGEFVYGWDGTDLVLIPTSSPDYAELTKLNEKRFENNTIKVKDLKVGATYLTKDNKQVVYMGRFDRYDSGYVFNGMEFTSFRKLRNYADKSRDPLYENTSIGWRSYSNALYEYDIVNHGKQHFFYQRGYTGYGTGFFSKQSISGLLIDTLSDSPAEDYADLFDKLEGTPAYSPPDKTKDQYPQCTLEEFLSRYGNCWFNSIVKDGDQYRYVEISPQRNGGTVTGFTCRYKDTRTVPECFGYSKKEDYRGNVERIMIPISLEEIYSKMDFRHHDKYLANGKFYEREY